MPISIKVSKSYFQNRDDGTLGEVSEEDDPNPTAPDTDEEDDEAHGAEE